MTSSRLRIFLCLIATVSAAVWMCGCATPLGPGYEIRNESLRVRFVPGDPRRLAIHAEFRMKNTGTKPLEAIAFGLPDEKGFGRSDLHVEMNGQELRAANSGSAEIEADAGESAASASWPAAEEFSLPSAWPKNKTRQFTLDYDLQPGAESNARIFVSADSFYLNDSGWFPNPLEAKGLLAKDITRPNSVDFRIDVPANFLATASGESRGKRSMNGGLEYRFRIRRDDFEPYVLAGAFQERQIENQSGNVAVWSRSAGADSRAQALAANLSAASVFFAKLFTPLPRDMQRILIVSGFSGARAFADAGSRLPAALPGIVFADPSNESLEAESALAETWFRHIVRPQPAASSLGGGLSRYAAELYRQRAVDKSRVETIRALLASENGSSPPNRNHKPTAANVQTSAQAIRAELFLFALEDRCGRENLQRGIAEMVYALRDENYGYNDFRAAVEQQCGQNLDRMFDDWLRRPGVPAPFRAKYGGANAKN